MIKTILAYLLLLQSSFLFANDANIKTKLDAAKVFLSGAELTHSATAEIPGKGNYELIFEGFAASINENSLQVFTDADVLILSVTSRINYLRSAEKTQEVIKLEDSLKYANLKKSKLNNERDILYMEVDLLNSNRQLTGGDKSVSIKEIQQFSKYYVDRLVDIKNLMLGVDLKIEEVEKDIKRISNQLNEVIKKRNQPLSEVVVNVTAGKAVKCNFVISYLNNNAGWNPIYDIRAKDIMSPLTLNYNAEVFQNSGIEWKDARIILSTRNPRENGNKPELYEWYLDFERENVWARERTMMMSKSANDEALQMGMVASKPLLENFVSITENTMAVEFSADVNYTIPSDNKAHKISLRDYQLPARFEYYTAPKVDNNAYLVAYVNEWKNLNLLPGKANIYFENSFVGESIIDPFTTEKELTLSLGRDKNIIVERKLLKDFTEDKFLSSDVERQFAYEIKIKNNKKNNVKLILEEQFPISKNEEIKVELINEGGAEVNKTKGILKWVLDLKTSEDISKQFVYSVRYPANKIIPGL